MPSATFLLFLIGLLPSSLWASVERYPSGLLSRFTADSPPGERLDEQTAVNRFVAEYFGAYRDFRWRWTRTDRDLTHSHVVFDLEYGGRRVAGHVLKIHYRRDGWVEYASSSWEHPFSLVVAPPSRDMGEELEVRLKARFAEERGIGDLRLQPEPVIWVSDQGRAHAATEVFASSRRKHYIGHFFQEEGMDRVLEELPPARSVDVPGKVYLKSPFGGAGFVDGTFVGLNAADKLAGPLFHVFRQTHLDNPQVVEINPSTVFTGDPDFSTDPADYAKPQATCGDTQTNTDPTKCPNQGFDGGNIYFHLQTYRTRLADLFSALGASPSVLRFDPMPVYVNAYIDLTGTGVPDSNNALYVPGGCYMAPNGQRCIVFARPAAGKLSLCGTGTIVFNDPGREAVVMVHEYQHYVTDMIAGLLSGSKGKVVADALHEGYSDYFGASQTSRVNGTDVTLVGQYFLQNCVPLQREISVPKRYENIAADSDEHYAGISWASGLWEIRRTLGVDTADKMVLKSLYFIPAQPGFFDAVESLVKADVSLNAGVNKAFIRDLFYNRIQFLGGAPPPFDATTKVIDVGFSGCNAAARGAAGGGGLLVVALWLVATVGAGRSRGRP